jgi:hypothetical protein
VEEKDKPQFSRNLEIDNSPLDRRTQARAVEPGQGPSLSAEEKSLYFRVEGEKVLQMLSLELSRPEPDPASLLLLRDLQRTWRTLWRGDDSFPVGPFTEMFELAFSILSSIVLLGRRVSLDERFLLDSLNQEMVRLVSGEASIACLESCRRLIEKVAPLSEKLKEESMGWSEKALRLNPGEERENDRGKAGVNNTVEAAKSDITSSVDEWFDQVTRLMVQPLPSGNPPARTGTESRNAAGLPARPSNEKRPDAGQIGLFAGEKNTVPRMEKAPAVMPEREKPPVRQVEKALSPETPVKQSPAPQQASKEASVSRTPAAGIAPPSGSGRQSAPAEVLTEEKAAGVTDDAGIKKPSMAGVPAESKPVPTGKAQSGVQGQPSADPASRQVEPPEEVLNYFRELSVITLEVLQHNLADISGTSVRREVRLVVSYLDDLLGTARDFGIESRVPPLEGLRESLQQAASGGQSGQTAGRLYRRVAEFAEKLSASLN